MAASAVLNSARTSSRIASETRDRIIEAARRLRYRPNAAARALANRRMDTIGVAAVIDNAGELNQYFLEIINGVLEAASRHNQNTTVFTVHDWDQDASRLAQFCDGRIDGMVLLAPVLSRENADQLPDHTPFVAVHANFAVPGVINLESDEETGALSLVRHLISRGHRRIMHISGTRGLLGVERRIQGYKRALAEAGIAFDDSLLLDAHYHAAAGRQAIRGWLSRSHGQQLPAAIFCANDGIATGCMEGLAECGIRVPEDVSVAGFDDTLGARTTVPQLTTVRQPLRSMGAKAVEILLGQINQPGGRTVPKSTSPYVFNTELVMRASVAAPPAAPRMVPRAP